MRLTPSSLSQTQTPENQQAAIIAFVIQACPDIRRKLPKLDGFEQMNGSQSLEIEEMYPTATRFLGVSVDPAQFCRMHQVAMTASLE